jgi:hypothetical protein
LQHLVSILIFFTALAFALYFLGGDWFMIGLAWRPICRIEISFQRLVSILIFFAAIGFGLNFRVGDCFWIKHS